MNVTPYNTTNYKRKHIWTLGENKPNSNPLKPNLRKAKMNINSIITKDYRKKDDFLVRINKPNLRKAQNERKLIYSKGLQKRNDFAAQKNKPNSNPILSAVGGLQMSANLYVIKDYRKKDDFVVRINKPNLRKAQNERKLIYSKGL